LHCLIFPLFHVLWPALVKWLQRQIVFLLIFKMNPTRRGGGVISVSCLMFWPIRSCPSLTHETHNTMQSQTCTLYGPAVALFSKQMGCRVHMGFEPHFFGSKVFTSYHWATPAPHDLTFSQLALTAVSCRCMCFIVNFK
jgi:hypothetical protein